MTSMTFGQLVAKQQMQDPSPAVVKAGDFVIPFGKHKGMNLSMLMEQQNGYCQWLLKQEPSKNDQFNETVKHLKSLIMADQSAIEDGVNESGVIDLGAEYPNKKPDVKEEHAIISGGNMMPMPPKPNPIDPTKHILPVGLLMGTVTDLMKQVDEGLTFDFSGQDIDLWLQLCSQVELQVNQFVIIETTHKSNASHAQKIKMVVSDLKKLKGVF